MPKILDLTKWPPFGRLTAKRLHPKRAKGGGKIWVCKCTCGKTVNVAGAVLVRGFVRSCGCLAKEYQKTTAAQHLRKYREKHEPARTHGMTGTRTHTAWIEMRRRCLDEKSKDFRKYGGRGITICPAWLDRETGFQAFHADMGDHPGPGYSLGRKENDKGYGPDNCEWQTAQEQNDNKTTTIRLTLDGRTQTLTAWAKELGVARSLVYQRHRRGFSTEDTLRV